MNIAVQNSTPPALPAPNRLDTMSTTNAFAIVRQSKGSILIGFMALATLFWALSLTLVKPSYVASSALLIHEHQQQQPIGGASGRASDVVTTDLVAIRTQLDMLQSRDLARNVARQAQLQDEPYFAPTKSWMHAAKLAALALVRDVNPGWADALDRPGPAETEQDKAEALVDRLIGMMSFVNDGRSYVITIRVKASPNANADVADVRSLVARIANTYADAYAEYTTTLGSKILRQVNAAVDNRLQSLMSRLTETENAVQAFRATSGMVDPQNSGSGSGSGSGITLLGQQVARMNDELAAASAEVARRDAALAAMKQSGPDRLAATADALNSVTIGRLREQRSTISVQLASALQRSGANFPDVLALRRSLTDVDVAISAELSRITDGAQTAASNARAHEAEVRRLLVSLQSQYATQQTKQAELIALQHKADAARSVYDEYLRRSSETASAAQMESSNIIVTSRANSPLHPTAPTATHFGLAGTIIALLFSCTIPLLRHRTRKTFQTLEQLKAATGIPVLGLVPKIRNLNARWSGSDADQLNEALASIRAVLRLRAAKPPQIIMVTSAIVGEGKTLLASAIARNAAVAGQRVLLVDCDLRRPSVLSLNQNESRLQPNPEGSGRMHLLWKESTSRLQVTALDPGDLCPQDFFSSAVVHRFFDHARSTFDLVVVDTPPAMLVSDTRVLAQYADAAVLVIDWSTTPRNCVIETVRLLEESGYMIAGMIPNRIAPAAMRRLHSALASVRQRYKSYPITLTPR